MSAPVITDERAEAHRLHDEEGLSERAIAAALGRSNSTIHKWLSEPAPAAPAPEPTAGQQTIDGGEVPASSNGHVSSAVYVEQIRVDGTTQVSIDFGGKRAQTCKLSVRGGAEVDGFFRKGDVIRGTFEAVVDGAGGKDKVDKQTGIVTEAVQRNTARITDMHLE